MKRFLILLILLSLCFTAACGQKEPKIQTPVTFYYLRTEITYNTQDSVICGETHEASGHQTDYEFLLRQYLLGPGSGELYSPIPFGTELKGFEIGNNIAILTLSDHMAQLQGMKLTAACACLAKTVMELTGTDSVEIRANSRNLSDTGSIVMSKDTLLLLDDAVIQPNP